MHLEMQHGHIAEPGAGTVRRRHPIIPGEYDLLLITLRAALRLDTRALMWPVQSGSTVAKPTGSVSFSEKQTDERAVARFS
jgi:hypothetical protein